MKSRLYVPLFVLSFILFVVATDGFRRPLDLPSQITKKNGRRVDNDSNGRRLRLEKSYTQDDSKSSSMALHAKSKKFKNFEEVLATYHEEPLMLIFTAMNCGPCKLMKEELKRASTLVGDKYKMFNVDTNHFPHVGSRFEVGALPCLLLVQNGEALLRIEGVVKAEDVVERVQTITRL